MQKKTEHSGDRLFWEIVNEVSPEANSQYQATLIILMAKYFETCDIFEEPK